MYFSDFGLSEKEEKIYLICLSLGTSPVSTIARRAGIKRPTTYLMLWDLLKRGFLSQSDKKGILHFSAIDPADLAEIFLQKNRLMDQKITLFRENIPKLRVLQSKTKDQPKISFYSGQEAIRKIYNSMKIIQNWSGFFDPSVFDIEDDGLAELKELCWSIWETLSSQKRHARDIIVDSKTGRLFRDKFASETYQIRIIKINPFASDIILFPDKVFLISYNQEMQLLEIQNESIVRMQFSMYDALWNSLKK